MDLACFVGLCERGPLGRAVPCDSWDEFLLVFGERGGFRLLPEAVHQFFVHGGRRCVVVRCVGADTPTAEWTMRGVRRWGSTDVRLAAHNPGKWAQETDPVLRPRVRPLGAVERISGDVLRGADAGIVPGSVLYFPAHDRFRVVTSTDGTDWTLGATVPATWARSATAADPRHIIPRVVEVTLDFAASHGALTEQFTGLGLDVRHPRWAVHELATRSQLVRPLGAVTTAAPGSTPTLRVDLEGPWDAMLTTPAAHDGEDTTTRDSFWSSVPATIDFWGGEPGVFEAMRVWDGGTTAGEEGSVSRELEPVTQLVCPDLVHPGVYHPDELRPPETTEEPISLRFEVCVSDEAEPEDDGEARVGSPYLHLEVGADYDDHVHQVARSCEADGRLALIDVPPSYDANDVMRLRRNVVSRRVAFYAPWLRVPNTDGSLWRLVGPAGAVAGIIAMRERDAGPGAIPANVELLGLLDLWEPSTLPDDAFLHEMRINRVRYDWGTYRVMGSRVAVEDSRSGHVNVQRLLLYLRRQLAIDGRFAVFAPNNEHLWHQLRQTIARRLDRLHQRGALAGRSAAEAYRIKVDADLNPIAALDAGEVRAHIGVAPSVPMEFIDVIFKLVANRGLEVMDA